jgi:hypothetical protein
VEAQRELIEPMRTQLDLLDFRVNGSFAGSHTNASSLGLEVVMTRLLAELIEQRGVLTRIAGTELGTRLAETPQQVKEILESALELLETRAAEIAEIAEKEHTALDTLDRLRIELRVPDEVASLDPEKAILESKYAPYRAFFEQRRTYAETQRLSQILRMKIAIERMEIPIGRAK